MGLIVLVWIWIVSLILAIVAGNQVGAAIGSGLAGFIAGVIAFVVFFWIGRLLVGFVIIGSELLEARRRHNSMYGKTKPY